MQNAIWFSRHQPVDAQVNDLLRNRSLSLVAIDEGRALGAEVIETVDDARRVAAALLDLARGHGASAAAGVWPVPLLEISYVSAYYDALACGESAGQRLLLLGAWSARRAQEGRPPVFEHHRFAPVGFLSPQGLTSY